PARPGARAQRLGARARGRGHGERGGGRRPPRLRRPPARPQAHGPGGDRRGGGGGPVSGRLTVVGLGPGSRDQLTVAADGERAAAQVVVGYRAYLDRLPAALAGGRREAYELGEERA